ncbi:hypothetical protein G9P44_005741 [Scheffersomyces stipitis]|nr:hypothetical protein G9P44_005741 [Scheffersomyces stipitis]
MSSISHSPQTSSTNPYPSHKSLIHSKSMDEYQKTWDSRIYVAAVSALASGFGSGSALSQITILDIFQKIKLTIAKYPNLHYTRSSNIVTVLLVYSSTSSEDMGFLAELLNAFVRDVDISIDFDMDLEEFSNWIINATNSGLPNDASLRKTAYDLNAECNSQAFCLSFSENDSASPETIELKFIQAKTLQIAKYFNDIHAFSGLFKEVHSYTTFLPWFKGLVESYRYYWVNYGSLNAGSVNFDQFLRLDSYSDQFDIMIEPLNKDAYSDKLSVSNWFKNVILPLINYNNNNFGPLLNWLFLEETVVLSQPASRKYDIWNKALKAIIEYPSIGFNDFKDVISYFLASCYYFALYHENSDRILTSEVIKKYDLIKDTLALLWTEKEAPSFDIQVSELPAYASFIEFLKTESNPLRPLFEPTGSSIVALSEIIDTCQSLYPINKLSIARYLELKNPSSAHDDKGKEVRKIIANVNPGNYNSLLSSAKLFYGKFVEDNDVEKTKVKEIVLERLLFANLFEVVSELYSTPEFRLPVNNYYTLISDKFWDSFNNSSSLNEKIGRFKDANNCVNLFDSISADPELEPENKDQIIRIKHLLKAIFNIKNFKLSLEKGKPFTPFQLVDKFRNVGQFAVGEKSTPLDLITIILEQNAKSYLAFEKLYKILNDLLLFFEDGTHESDTHYFNKLKSACIESSLVANDFQFAYAQSMGLFDHYVKSDSNLNDIWLTFYQVGKYVSPLWFDDDSYQEERIQILCKQREILSRTIQIIQPNSLTSDNSKVILSQWERVNSQIEEHYTSDSVSKELQFSEYSAHSFSEVTDNLGYMANELISDATATTNKTSEKLSNLFVSGLGWAIGANQQQ